MVGAQVSVFHLGGEKTLYHAGSSGTSLIFPILTTHSSHRAVARQVKELHAQEPQACHGGDFESFAGSCGPFTLLFRMEPFGMGCLRNYRGVIPIFLLDRA